MSGLLLTLEKQISNYKISNKKATLITPPEGWMTIALSSTYRAETITY